MIDFKFSGHVFSYSDESKNAASLFGEWMQKAEKAQRFFGNPKWSSTDPADSNYAGYKLVNCVGEITYNNKPATGEIQFIVDEVAGTFLFNAFEINGVPQNKYRQVELLNAMYE